MEKKTIEIKCFEIEQPIGNFYVGAIDSADLINISYADIRRIETPKLDTYLGIQRRLSAKRVEELERFVRFPDATFPTGIVLCISSEHAAFDERRSILKIRNDRYVAKIIDGQHRIASLERLRHENFQLPVTVFIDMDIEQQAIVFTTINLAQTKISRSLLYDLYEHAKSRSPQKTAHNIVRLLNFKEGSPLEHRIKILGIARIKSKEKPTLTQAIVVETLLILMCGSVEQANFDRDLMKAGKKINQKIDNEEMPIFRRFFLQDKDAEITLIIWNFLAAAKRKWQEAWDEPGGKSILISRNGFRAIMRFHTLIYNSIGRGVPTENEYFINLNRMNFRSTNFRRKIYFKGKEGENKLYADLVTAFNASMTPSNSPSFFSTDTIPSTS